MAYPNRIPALRDAAHSRGPEVVALASEVLDDARFAEWTGSVSPDKHHHGAAGLQQHTWEVMQVAFTTHNALDNAFHGINTDALFLAALYHDFGKTHDYTFVVDERGDRWWSPTPHYRRINHLNRSAVLWIKAVEKHNVCRDIEDEVLHAILSHHGQFGSSVMPKTKLAWLLHLADQMSARMDDCDRLDLGVRK